MPTFTAIDFETAQGKRWSICQVGLVRVEQGVVAKEYTRLVQPPGNFYWDWFTDTIHGISPGMTANAPTFDRVWDEVRPYIEGQLVVAHNGFGFDFQVLAQTLEYYGLPVPAYRQQCTYRIFRAKLNLLCANYNIPLEHHDALSDARACAALYRLHFD